MDDVRAPRVRIVYRVTSAFLLAAAIAAHMLLTLLSITPLNPIGLKHSGLVSAYTYPAFSQRWSLFSPQPLSETQVLIAQARLEHRAAGRQLETGWMDLTSATRQLARNHISTPVTRVLRMHMSPSVVLQPDENFMRLRAAICKDQPGNELCKQPLVPEWVAKRSQELLARVACATLRSMIGTEWKIVTVRLRLTSQSPVPFSQRYNSEFKPTVRFVETQWFPYVSIDGPR